MKELTKEQAIALYDAKHWEGMTLRDRAMFQMFQPKLSMPFDIFHEAVEKTLGRPVWTHEFGFNWEGLKKELLGESAPPTFEEIMNLIPKEKRVFLIVIEKEIAP